MRYAGFSNKYGADTVCATKKDFNTYTAAHKFILAKNLRNQGPYPCKFKLSNKDHYHLSSNKESVKIYHIWLKTGSISYEYAKKEYENIERLKLNSKLRDLARKLNGNITHQDIMDEIEFGWKITGIRISRINVWTQL